MSSYTKIPFIGSKYRYKNKIYNILNGVGFDFQKEWIIFDIFGGSGALSLIFKSLCPNSKIIFNDYDNIITNNENINVIDNSIDTANKIINEIKESLKTYTLNKNYKFNDKETIIINNILNKYNNEITNDYIVNRILSSQLCFNSRHINKKTSEYFNKIKKNGTPLYYKNFKDIEIKHNDFEDMFKFIINNFNNKDNILILLDPPYLYTDVKDAYHMEKWNLSKYLKIITFINKNPNFYYIMFEGNWSKLDDLFDFINDNSEINFKNRYNKTFDLSDREYMKIIK